MRPNNSETLNPLLHLQSLQQIPQTSGCIEGYSETIGNYRYQQHNRYDGYDYSYPSRDNYYHETTQHEHATQHDRQRNWNAIIGQVIIFLLIYKMLNFF